jgi:hypothetical protein
MAQGGLGDVERAEHVDLEEVAGIDVRVRDRDLGAQVQYDFATLDRSRYGLHVAQFTEHDLNLS